MPPHKRFSYDCFIRVKVSQKHLQPIRIVESEIDLTDPKGKTTEQTFDPRGETQSHCQGERALKPVASDLVDTTKTL